MDRKRWLAVGAVLALVALIAVWQLRGGSDASEAGAGVEPAAAQASTATRGARAVDPATLERGRISGTVRDQAGNPVAGALVCGFAGGDELSTEETREPACATSDPAGVYRLAELVPADYWVGASARGFEPAHHDVPDDDDDDRVPLAAGQSLSGIDIEMRAGGVEVTGVVLDIGGGPIAGARVSIGGRGRGTAMARSGDDGSFTTWTRAGRVWASATADGYGQAWREAVAPGMKIELRLTPESVLSGRVVEAGTGEPVAGALVTAVANRSDPWRRSGREGTAFTGNDGRFRITRLSPGRYKPVATGRGLYGTAGESVLLGLGETRDEVVIEVHPARVVTGKAVTAGSGEPCAGGSVTLRDPAREREERARIKDGGGVELEAVLPGSYDVTVRCSDRITGDDYPAVEVAGEDVTGLVWEVEAGGAVAGKVVDAAGEPVAGVYVGAEQEGGDPRARRRWSGDSTDDDGRFEIDGLEAGSYRLEARPDEQPEPAEPTTVEVAVGQTADATITLPSGGEIRGVVVDEHGAPQTGITVRAVGKQRSWRLRATTIDDGSFVIRGVEAGDYRVVAQRGWQDVMRAPGASDSDVHGERVTVTDDRPAEVRLVVEQQDGVIRGQVVDASGAPISDAFISTSRMSDRPGASASRAVMSTRWSWLEEPVLTDPDGSFEVTKLAPGNYVVRAYRRGGGEAIAEEVAVGSTITLTIRPTASVAGTVTIEGGGAPEELTVVITDQKTGFERAEQFFRTGGRWSLRDLPAGNYVIAADAAEGSARTELTLKDGERKTGIDLGLAAKVTITGRVVDMESGDPVAGMMVNVSPVKGGDRGFRWDERDNKHVTGDDGRFEYERAPTGRLYVQAFPRDFEHADYMFALKVVTAKGGAGTVDVGDIAAPKRRIGVREQPGDLGFELEAMPQDTDPDDAKLVVSAIRPGGPAAGSGLEVGDQIVSIDGRDATGPNSYIFHVLSRAPAGTKITFGLAGGDRAEVTLGLPR